MQANEPAIVEDAAPVFAGWPNFATSTIPAEETVIAESPVEAAPSEAVSAPSEPAQSEPEEPWSIAPEEHHDVELAAVASQYDQQHEDPIGEEDVTAEPQLAGEPHRMLANRRGDSSDDPTEPIPVAATQHPSDGVDRALDLIDELRSLIPTLNPLADRTGNSANAAAILSKASTGEADSDALSQLRGVVQTANACPRDIDVMLDLVSRAGAIQDVLAERDRYAAAIAKALAALGDQAE